MKFNDIVQDRITHQSGRVFASVLGRLMTYGVSLEETGATAFYCANCQRMYPPKSSCPECDIHHIETAAQKE